MSDEFYFDNILYKKGNITVEINLDRFSRQFTEAQQWLGDRVLEDCKARMPHLTGNLQQRSHTEEDGKKVVFPGPYARYLYSGKVMVDSITGKGPMKIPTGPGESILRFREGAKLVPTNRRLDYSNPQAVDHWFDEAKAQHGEYWIEGVKRIAGKGKAD